MKKYVKVQTNSQGVTHLKIELYYNLGGMNYFTNRVENRGYHLSVSPIKKVEKNGYISETYTAYSGITQNVKEVKRKSKKAELEAEQIANEVLDGLICVVCIRNKLEMCNL